MFPENISSLTETRDALLGPQELMTLSKPSALKSGPVRSFGPNLKDRDRDRSSQFGKLQKTGPQPK